MSARFGRLPAAVAALCFWAPVSGYEIPTHAQFAVRAIQGSPNMARALKDLGLEESTELTDQALTKSIRDWLSQGSMDEDDTVSTSFARYRNHFYDPTPGAPNNGGFAGILPPLNFLSGSPAPDWSLEPTRIPGQNYSYPDARQDLLKGLTEPYKIDRDKYLATTFYGLGHVVHTIQDMASPQHARNDAHGGGSFYEIFTNDAVRGRVPGYELTYNGAAAPVFSSVKDLWLDLAKFSNRNFVTAGKGRNFRYSAGNWLPSERYPNPKPFGATEEVPIEQLPGIVLAPGDKGAVVEAIGIAGSPATWLRVRMTSGACAGGVGWINENDVQAR